MAKCWLPYAALKNLYRAATPASKALQVELRSLHGNLQHSRPQVSEKSSDISVISSIVGHQHLSKLDIFSPPEQKPVEVTSGEMDVKDK